MDTKGSRSLMRLSTLHEACRPRGKFRPAYLCGSRFALFGPGRADPAPVDFRTKPLPPMIWRLETSFVRTPAPDPIISNQHSRPIIKQALSSTMRRLYQHQGCVPPAATKPPLTQLTTASESIREYSKYYSANSCIKLFHRSSLIISVVPTAARRHCRSLSPEIPGRIVFFVIETGRSPPLGGSSPSGAASNGVTPRKHSTFHK